jgi:GntR family transcriptional repressor for pyruvate dehydrogenase complex
MSASYDPVPFEALSRRETLPDEIARRISDEIAGRRFAPGDRLPTEAALAGSFGVSRNVVREAIARLKSEGLVETRQGLGAFVAEAAPRAFRIEPERLQEDDLRHVLELRLHVEMGAAALAAERRTAAQLERIHHALQAMARAVETDGDGVPADAEFHHAIAEAANNPYYRDFMIFLADRMQASIAAARANSAKLRWSPLAEDEHASICEAIAARNPAAAREAVRRHLVSAARRLGLAPPSHPEEPAR